MMKKYGVILADPPWQYDNYAAPPGEIHGRARGAQKYYPTMELEDLFNLPINNLIDSRCVLFMWATWPLIDQALDLINAWGFEYKSLAWEWIKWNPSGLGIFVGMGYYTRSNPEPCLLAFKGGSIPPVDRSVSAVLFSNLQAHSKKPPEQYDRIHRMYPDLPKLELFARRKHLGWDVWGNEVKSDIELPLFAMDILDK